MADYVFIFTGGFVIGIFIIKREWLIQQSSFRVILAVSWILFLVGIAFHFAKPSLYSSSGALIAPILTLGLFRFSRKVFVERFKHEPRDTFLNSGAGLAADMVFNFTYFVSAIFLLMISSVGIEKLAKAGW